MDIEELITQARLALCYADRAVVLETLIASGVEPGLAFLVVLAARLLP